MSVSQDRLQAHMLVKLLYMSASWEKTTYELKRGLSDCWDHCFLELVISCTFMCAAMTHTHSHAHKKKDHNFIYTCIFKESVQKVERKQVLCGFCSVGENHDTGCLWGCSATI